MVFRLGFESAEHEVFEFKPGDFTSNPATVHRPIIAADPTPTPLPVHFPTVPEAKLAEGKDGYLSLTEAFTACWPQAAVATTPPDGEITPLEAENLFGKIKKR